MKPLAMAPSSTDWFVMDCWIHVLDQRARLRNRPTLDRGKVEPISHTPTGIEPATVSFKDYVAKRLS